MKYIVEVNAKYLVSVEATSCLNAEHQLLNYNGVWGALAFDQKELKFDTFLGAVHGCDMISIKELEQLIVDVQNAKDAAIRAKEEQRRVQQKLEALREQAKEIEAMIKLTSQHWEAATNDVIDTAGEYERMQQLLGKQRN